MGTKVFLEVTKEFDSEETLLVVSTLSSKDANANSEVTDSVVAGRILQQHSCQEDCISKHNQCDLKHNGGFMWSDSGPGLSEAEVAWNQDT